MTRSIRAGGQPLMADWLGHIQTLLDTHAAAKLLQVLWAQTMPASSDCR